MKNKQFKKLILSLVLIALMVADFVYLKTGASLAFPLILSTDDDETKAAKKLLNETKDEAVKEALEKLEAKQKLEKEAADKVIEKLKKANKETQDHADELDQKLQGIVSGEEAGFKTMEEALADAFKGKKEEIDAIVAADGKQTATLTIEFKAAVDMSVTNTIGSGATAVTITDNTGRVSTIRKRSERYLAKVTVGRTSGNRALWIEETDEQGDPLFIGEGVGKPAASVRYVEKTANVKKVAVYGKVTTEMLADLPQLISYIKNNLAKRLEIKKEDGLFGGDNVGDNLNGAKNTAVAFAAGALAAGVKLANEFDVLEAIGTQVDLAFGDPNAVYVNPTTIQKMKAIKSTAGHPLWKDYVDINGGRNMVVHNMEVIPTTLVPVGEFLGGDMTAANVLFRDTMTAQIGLDGNDFTNNKKTILLEQRLVQYVSANDVKLIVKGTFAAAITALLAP
ncbi:phage major capsid family protein [Pedobacter duraquae]|uniref:Capsid family protein n=1 Tax=Pedobacter duraquae TaxID=425511 RepID=A0A4R6IIZ0_9SPHI|nr:phage major capsid protein [Pedobacter duraquae]TDO21895.1 capsid family protein [Pedobacter duraquae]